MNGWGGWRNFIKSKHAEATGLQQDQASGWEHLSSKVNDPSNIVNNMFGGDGEGNEQKLIKPTGNVQADMLRLRVDMARQHMQAVAEAKQRQEEEAALQEAEQKKQARLNRIGKYDEFLS